MKNKLFSIQARWNSFQCALTGLRIFAIQETNAKIQIVAASVAVILGFLFDISRLEWLAISISIAVVLALEIVNSAIERLCDLYSKSRSPMIKEIKDLSASAVLVTSFAAAINGILILVPKALLQLLIVIPALA